MSTATNTAHWSTEAFERVLQDKGVVLVDFWAEWCPPCRVLGPTIDQLADRFEGRALVGKVDVDANQDLAGRFGVQSIPTVVVLKDGQEVERFVGVRGLDELSDALESALKG